jgi:hypothetical protein
MEVLQIELNTTYRKYQESAHMPLVAHLIQQQSFDLSPIRTPTTEEEAKKL